MPVVPKKHNNSGFVNFPIPEERENMFVIEMGAATHSLGEVQALEQSRDNFNPDELGGQVDTVANLMLHPTSISFDQLVSGSMPPLDAPMSDINQSDCVAIVHFQTVQGNQLLCFHHPPMGQFLACHWGQIIWIGRTNRAKHKEENINDQCKVANNMLAMCLKKMGDSPLLVLGCKIFFLVRAQ